MMFSSLAAVTVSGFLASAALVPSSNWQADYGKALAQAAAENKAVAVFIGKGEAGYATLVSGGKISDDAEKSLKANYVVVYVNTATTDGEKLASAFAMKEGVVVSTRGGASQAVRHGGPVSSAELSGYLARGAATSAVASTEARGTETPAAPAVVPASATVAAPAYAPAPVFAPQAAYPAVNWATGGANCASCQRR